MDIPFKKEKIQEELARLAARYFAEESSKKSLITITRSVMSDDLGHATIFFTVLPTDQETEALAFAKRREIDFKNYAKTKGRIGRVPYIVFAIDAGERNREKIDAALKGF
jgi:ribosome-binding factor A